MSYLQIVIVFALVCTAFASHTINGRNGKGTAEISAKGPHMKIKLQWVERRSCLNGRKPLFDILYYDDWNGEAATPIETKYPNTSLTIESPIPALDLNILFWRTHKIRIMADCPFKHEVDRFRLEDLRGDLLPVESVTYEPRESAAVVSWTLSKLQYAATHVLVKSCRSQEEDDCTAETVLPITQTNYTIEGLTPGIKRTAFVRLKRDVEKDGSYFSDFKKLTIEALPPPEDSFPTVQNLTANIVRNGSEDADVSISYAKPKNSPSGATWWGIEANVTDLFGQTVLEDFQTQNLSFKLPNLSLFSDMTAQVRAIYTQGSERVLSAAKSVDFYTGIGYLAKPQIARVVAIDDTKALVEWSHTKKDNFETNFTIIYDGGKQKEILMSTKTHAVLDNLSPGQTYGVNIKAHILHDMKPFENISDTVNVTMLPRDALKPQLSCGEIALAGMELNWQVVMPEDSENCRFAINICPTGASAYCKQQRNIKSDQRSATVDFFPFENQTLEVVTTCHYYPDVTVEKTSEPLVVFGGFNLSAVDQLDVHALNETSVQISFVENVDEAQFVEGYKIQWTPDGSDPKQVVQTGNTSFILNSLKANSTYDVSVAPYTSQAHGGLVGFAARAQVLTQLPVPPSVTELKVAHKPMTYDVTLAWKKQDYAYGELAFEIDASCGSWKQNYTTKSTNFNLTVTANHKEQCSFEVMAVTDVAGQPQRRSEVMKENFTFEGLEPPEEIRLIGCPNPFKYDLEVIPPESAKSFDIRYQLARSWVSYQSSETTNAFAVMNYHTAFPVDVKARICSGDVCSTDKTFQFMTNSGSPTAVESMKMTIRDNTNILMQWEKPLDPRGPIDGYLIKIRDEETKKITTVVLLGNETSYTYKSDKEHVEYRIEYCAFNNDRCAPGRFEGRVLHEYFLTSGKRSPPPKKLETGSIGAEDGIYWSPPENLTVTKYHIVASPAPKEGYEAPGAQVETIDLFTTVPRIPFSVFKPYTTYDIDISSCTAEKEESCGRSFHDKLYTGPGHPGELKAIKVNATTDTISVSWTTPKDPAGPISGYKLAFQELALGESPTDWITYDGDTHSATLQNLTAATDYVIHIIAYNQSPHGELSSPVAVVYAATEGFAAYGAVPTVLSIISAIIVLAVVVFLAYKSFKRPRSEDWQRLNEPALDLHESMPGPAE